MNMLKPAISVFWWTLTAQLVSDFFKLANELEDEFQTKVDVVSRKGIKPHYLPYIERNLIQI